MFRINGSSLVLNDPRMPQICPFKCMTVDDTGNIIPSRLCLDSYFSDISTMTDLPPGVTESSARAVLQEGYNNLAALIVEGNVQSAMYLAEVARPLLRAFDTLMKDAPVEGFVATMEKAVELLSGDDEKSARCRYDILVTLGNFYWMRGQLDRDPKALPYYLEAKKMYCKKNPGVDTDYLRLKLAEIYFEDRFGPQKAVETLKPAVQNGCMAATKFMGFILNFAGSGQEMAQGRKLLWKAALSKYPEAMRIVGQKLLQGEDGFDCDPQQGVNFLEGAIAEGCVSAAFNLASAYEEGYGVEKDACLALNFYQVAQDMGDETAENHIKRILESNDFVGIHPECVPNR